MGQKLGSAPVYFTVAQVQFNPILNLESYLPAIQLKMREARFSDYRHEVFPQFVLPFGVGNGSQAMPLSLSSQPRYTFGSIEGRTSLVLESNSLALQTTEYDTFETFSSDLLKGLAILHEAIHLEFTERIGLRYLDAVIPLKDDETIADYLAPEMLGLALKTDGQLLQSVTETSSITEAGQLVARVIIRDGLIGLPLDLSSLAPAINPKFTKKNCRHAVIDTDASYAQREAFSIEKVGAHLLSLHDAIDKSFKSVVTPHALIAWK